MRYILPSTETANHIIAPYSSDGDYGPFTSGTSTSGFQEALDNGSGVYYVRAGTYTINEGVAPTADYTVVIFESGVTINSTLPSATVLFNFSSVSTITDTTHNTNPSATPFIFIAYRGNHATINLVQNNSNASAFGCIGSGNNGTAQSTQSSFLYIDDFVINISGTAGSNAIFFSAGYAVTVTPSLLNSVHNVYVSNLHIKSTVSGGVASVISCYGGVNTAYFNNIMIDGSGIANTVTDYSLLSAYSKSGATTNVYFQNIVLISNGEIGQIFELQGCTETTGTVITQNVKFVNCQFVSPSSGVVYAGSGGAFIDDNNGTSNGSYVNRITFDSCVFNKVGITFQNTSTYFGFVRFINTTVTSTGTLNGRTGNYTTAITVGPSPFQYYSSSDGMDEIIIVTGGTVTQIDINGINTGLTSGAFILPNGPGTLSCNIKVTYTAAPSMYKSSIG